MPEGKKVNKTALLYSQDWSGCIDIAEFWYYIVYIKGGCSQKGPSQPFPNSGEEPQCKMSLSSFCLNANNWTPRLHLISRIHWCGVLLSKTACTEIYCPLIDFKGKFSWLQMKIFIAIFIFISVGGEFPLRLDEVSEHYFSKSLCEGEECNHLKVQVGQLKVQVVHLKV